MATALLLCLLWLPAGAATLKTESGLLVVQAGLAVFGETSAQLCLTPSPTSVGSASDREWWGTPRVAPEERCGGEKEHPALERPFLVGHGERATTWLASCISFCIHAD